MVTLPLRAVPVASGVAVVASVSVATVVSAAVMGSVGVGAAVGEAMRILALLDSLLEMPVSPHAAKESTATTRASANRVSASSLGVERLFMTVNLPFTCRWNLWACAPPLICYLLMFYIM